MGCIVPVQPSSMIRWRIVFPLPTLLYIIFFIITACSKTKFKEPSSGIGIHSTGYSRRSESKIEKSIMFLSKMIQSRNMAGCFAKLVTAFPFKSPTGGALRKSARNCFYVHPGAASVLLKILGILETLNKYWSGFPQARFIYITREPIYILNSLVNAVHALGTGKQPFQTLLVDDFSRCRAVKSPWTSFLWCLEIPQGTAVNRGI